MLPIKGTRRPIIIVLLLSFVVLFCLFGWTKISNSNSLGATVTLPHKISDSSNMKPMHRGSTFSRRKVNEKGCMKLPKDVILFDGVKDSSLCCKTCAIVSSSGIMQKSNFGSQIDNHDCVIRMNNAPTINFEDDVGRRTTIRVSSHTSVIDVKRMLRTHERERNDTVFVVWGPERNMVPGGITYNFLKRINAWLPGIEIHVFSQKRMKDCDDKFESETGKNRLQAGVYLSTGWFTILLARDICENIDVFGMVEDDYCERIKFSLIPDAPYHYYDRKGTQCATYNLHERAARGSHKFLTEKKIFKKWAKEWGNMKFYNPEWNLA